MRLGRKAKVWERTVNHRGWATGREGAAAVLPGEPLTGEHPPSLL